MRRIAVVGQSGTGKTTLARRLADRLDAESIDLDALYHGPGWTPAPTAEFRQRVLAATQCSSWVVSGNYPTVSDLVQGRADTIVWLDLARWRTLPRRSIVRALTRRELWNGNRERWRDLLSRDPERNPIVWSWQSQPKLCERFETFAGGSFWARADVHRLRTPGQVRAFLAGVDRDDR
ncbi:MAG: adenylate kinase [Ilumatobacter sp.]|uniref:adenylate kinase n=1 Tax=Ilumatobacter sp. TaxID=1967498 RepID=UPI00391DC823